LNNRFLPLEKFQYLYEIKIASACKFNKILLLEVVVFEKIMEFVNAGL